MSHAYRFFKQVLCNNYRSDHELDVPGEEEKPAENYTEPEHNKPVKTMMITVRMKVDLRRKRREVISKFIHIQKLLNGALCGKSCLWMCNTSRSDCESDVPE